MPTHRFMPRRQACIAALAFALAALPAQAINKCTDAKTGQVSYTDGNCPADSRNTRMEFAPNSRTNVVSTGATPGSVPTRREPNPGLQFPAEGRALAELYRRWIDAERLATATSRIALAGPVAALQDLSRQVAAAKLAPCLDEARAALGKLVAESVEGFLQFMGKDSGEGLMYQWAFRAKYIDEFEAQVRMACGLAGK